MYSKTMPALRKRPRFRKTATPARASPSSGACTITFSSADCRALAEKPKVEEEVLRGASG